MQTIVPLQALDRSQVALAGGKAANLGELTRIPGVAVPPGFCVTADVTDAQIAEYLATHWAAGTWAVRSSATAEDLPGASFAGQHESYLNVRGVDAVIDAVHRCRTSLFTERAVTYRQRQGIDRDGVAMAVVVQRMVQAEVSGVMFTAEPVGGDRTIVAIEACAGTGDALASGTVVPESVRLRDGQVIDRTTPGGQLLDDEQARELAALGQRIAAHFGAPQDIEWCLADGRFWIVQSRPITTLFPVPRRDDGERHVYLSVGHQQMMTDALTPLGLSMWQMLAACPMHEAGGRLFVDVTARLASPASRKALLHMLSRDPLIASAVNTLLERGFVATLPEQEAAPVAAPPSTPAPEPAIVAVLMRESEEALAHVRNAIAGKAGVELFDFIADDMAALKRQLNDTRSMRALMAGIEAQWWLDDHLDEKGVADILSQSVDNNVSSQMGLDLLDVADVVRQHPAAVSFLRQMGDGTSLAGLAQVDGGREALAAIERYLDRYGMRCAGEIDIARTRWRERPAILVPMILAHVDRFSPGEAARRFAAGLARARAAEREVLERLRGHPEAAQLKEAIDRLRAFIGYREYPKYGWMCRIDVHKQALMREAGNLVRSGVIDCADDVFFLRFDELREVVKTQHVDRNLIAARRAEFAAHERLLPPRVLTSDGESLFGTLERGDLPQDALAGLGVSAGIVEGRARVVSDIGTADIAPGDILVTAYTDPSWTPLFLSVAGLVTEAGGQMSHGAVVAREYGLPAVVAVKDATRTIRDGQRIRLDGTRGIVTPVPAP